MTRPGIAPARFIYLATDGAAWRVHASINSTAGGSCQVLHREYFRDRGAALRTVDKLINDGGGPDQWLVVYAQPGGV